MMSSVSEKITGFARGQDANVLILSTYEIFAFPHWENLISAARQVATANGRDLVVEHDLASDMVCLRLEEKPT